MNQVESQYQVQIDLFIKSKEHQLFAKLTFINNSDKDLWLEERKVAYNGTILIDCFIINDVKNNTRLSFKGPIARFRDPIEEDYIIVKPNQSYSSKFRLDDKYSFSERESKYSVQFSSVMFPLDEDTYIDLKSNIASITF